MIFDIFNDVKELNLKAINKCYSIRFVHAVLPFDKITITVNQTKSEMVIYINTPERLKTSEQAQTILANSLIQWLDKIARNTYPTIIKNFAQKHQLTNPPHFRTTIATTKWGSYKSDGTISISLWLLFYSREALNHVIVHELCHTRCMDHGTGFKALLNQMCPETPFIKKELNTPLSENLVKLFQINKGR
ncbi:MAG: M48 family metallopeptidase [Kiritimatiellae bacterium]|nr:M48 family metallopeptidase [Kiritimatiellia bacterium]